MLLDLIFLSVSFVLIMSSIMVVSSKNSLHSLLFLILSFVSASLISFLFECEFVGLIFILIYVGAIAVLFLFVVMMLDIKTVGASKDLLKYFPVSVFLGCFFFIEIIYIVFQSFPVNPYKNTFLTNFYVNWADKADALSDIQVIGQILYTQYIIQFLVIGLILLVGVLGAVVLTLKLKPSNSLNKNQIIFKQLARKSKNSIVLY